MRPLLRHRIGYAESLRVSLQTRRTFTTHKYGSTYIEAYVSRTAAKGSPRPGFTKWAQRVGSSRSYNKLILAFDHFEGPDRRHFEGTATTSGELFLHTNDLYN